MCGTLRSMPSTLLSRWRASSGALWRLDDATISDFAIVSEASITRGKRRVLVGNGGTLISMFHWSPSTAEAVDAHELILYKLPVYLINFKFKFSGRGSPLAGRAGLPVVSPGPARPATGSEPGLPPYPPLA